VTLAQPRGVLPATFDQRVHQCIAIFGVDAGHVADVVARLAHGAQ
jgi:hypothetical protein